MKQVKIWLYKDIHMLWALSFPAHEKPKLLGTDFKGMYQIWQTSSPLDEETIKGLDLRPAGTHTNLING